MPIDKMTDAQRRMNLEAAQRKELAEKTKMLVFWINRPPDLAEMSQENFDALVNRITELARLLRESAVSQRLPKRLPVGLGGLVVEKP